MSPQVTFQTEFFQPELGEDKETNPGCFGRALARWLSGQLQARGVDVEGVIAEDFGWIVMVSRKPFLLWLGCGNVEDSRNEWLIFAVGERSIFQRLFRRIDTKPAVDDLWRHVRELVPTIPGAQNITWE